MKVLAAQLCLTLYDPMDCSPPNSSIRGNLLSRILEWFAIPISKGFFPTQGLNLGLLHHRQIFFFFLPFKRWQEYTEELYKKDLPNPDNHDGVITHLEPDILECEVKWALESITTNKASAGNGIPVELFQILKDDATKVLH